MFIAAIANFFLKLGVLFKLSITSINLLDKTFCVEAQLLYVVVLFN